MRTSISCVFTAARKGNESISIELKKLLAVTERGHKLFVPDGVPTDIAIARLQQYIYQVRPQIQDEDSTRPMTHYESA